MEKIHANGRTNTRSISTQSGQRRLVLPSAIMMGATKSSTRSMKTTQGMVIANIWDGREGLHQIPLLHSERVCAEQKQRQEKPAAKACRVIGDPPRGLARRDDELDRTEWAPNMSGCTVPGTVPQQALS